MGATKMLITIGLLNLLLASGFPVPTAGEDCGASEYLDRDGICKTCNRRTCQAGEKVKEPCGFGNDLTCEPCTDLPAGKTCAKGNVRDCITCKSQNKKTVRECDAHLDRVCYGCLDGYFPKVDNQGEVHCIHCSAETNNRSECRENPVIECAPVLANNALPGPEDDRRYKDSQRWIVIAAVAVAAAVIFLAVALVLVAFKQKLCKPRGPYLRAPARDAESPDTTVTESTEESSSITEESEDDHCHVEQSSEKVKFTKARKTRNQSEDGQQLLESRRHKQLPKLKMPKRSTSSEGELEFRVSGSRTSSPVKAVPSPKKGTPSPFPVSDEGTVFSYPNENGNQTADVQHHLIRDAQTPFEGPTTSQASTPTGSLDLSGQTARLHKDSRTVSNNTANDYATKLTWCKELASSILLDDEWFSFNIQQTLAVYLDRIPPTSSMPTWRTFFEFKQFGLTKHDLDGVNTQSVNSPTLALFAVLQSRNAMNRHTVWNVLKRLHSLKVYDAANFLCDELLKSIQKPKS